MKTQETAVTGEGNALREALNRIVAMSTEINQWRRQVETEVRARAEVVAQRDEVEAQRDELLAALKGLFPHCHGQYLYDEDGEYVEEMPIQRLDAQQKALAAIANAERGQQ